MSRRYSLPDKDTASKFYELLKQFYKGRNQQRLSFLEIFKSISNDIFRKDSRRIDVLVGMLIFEMEIIRLKEYKGFSPAKRKAWFEKGSDFYTDIKKILSISKQKQIRDDERFILVLAFFKYLETCGCFEKKMIPCWKSLENLLKDIISVLNVLKDRENRRISLMTYGPPNLEILRSKILELLSLNSSRSLLPFIKLISETCEKIYPDEKLKDHNHDFSDDLLYLQSCNAQLGLILFVLMNIHEEYKYYKKIWSPEHSRVYKKCLEALNAKQLEDIEQDKTVIWLRALLTHLDHIKQNPELYQTQFKDAYEKRFSLIQAYEKDIERFLIKEENKKRAPSRPVYYLIKATNFATQYGLSFLFTQATKEWALQSIGSSLLLETGPIGLVIYGATGTIVMTQLGRLIGGQLPAAVGCMYAWVLDKVGHAVAKRTVDAATYAFSVSQQGLEALLNHPDLDEEDKGLMKDFINSLLKAPNEVIPIEDKNHLRIALGDGDIENNLMMRKKF